MFLTSYLFRHMQNSGLRKCCMTLRLFHTDSYDIVTVVGSHIANHIESEALIEIIRLVKSGESNDWKKN